tara:strand:+ start:1294 stop:1773 length:480 start_codon:yes stop_codon:yes gene_type:complete
MLTAIPILEDKYWIIENKEGEKVGILNHNHIHFKNASYKFTSTSNQKSTTYSTTEVVEHFNFMKSGVVVESKQTSCINEYPVCFKPFNAIYNVQKQLALFTKNDKSHNYYCAGYFAILFDNAGWQWAFCPKLKTLEKYEYLGPVKTEDDVKALIKKEKK